MPPLPPPMLSPLGNSSRLARRGGRIVFVLLASTSFLYGWQFGFQTSIASAIFYALLVSALTEASAYLNMQRMFSSTNKWQLGIAAAAMLLHVIAGGLLSVAWVFERLGGGDVWANVGGSLLATNALAVMVFLGVGSALLHEITDTITVSHVMTVIKSNAAIAKHLESNRDEFTTEAIKGMQEQIAEHWRAQIQANIGATLPQSDRAAGAWGRFVDAAKSQGVHRAGQLSDAIDPDAEKNRAVSDFFTRGSR